MPDVRKGPPRSPTDRRPQLSEIVTCRVTEAEKIQLLGEAIRRGLPISTVIREALFERETAA